MIPPSPNVMALLFVTGCVSDLDKAKDTAATRDSEHSSEPPGDDTGPVPTDSDPGHSTHIDDSVGTDSGTSGDSGASDDSGEPGDGVVDLSYADCTGDADDGRVVKICGTVGVRFSQTSGAQWCDSDGDGQKEIVVGCSYGLCRPGDPLSSHMVTEGAFITNAATTLISSYPRCNGDRDSDGYQDLTIAGEYDTDTERVYTFDGPFPDGSTYDDPVGVLDADSYRFIGDLAWAPGLGLDGGDGVLVGSQQDYYSLGWSESYYLSDPSGTHTWEDVTARFTSGGEPDVVVGRTVRSADMDGDGVSEIILGMDDDDWSAGSVDPSQAQILWYDATATGEVDVSLTGYEGRIWSDDDLYAVIPDQFAVGDIDQDGYPDVVSHVEISWEDRIQTTICYSPAFSGCRMSRMDAYIEVATEYDPYPKKPAVLGDLDGDGRAGDLALVLGQYLFLYASPPSGYVTEGMDATLNFGDGRFTYLTPISDINDDGLADLILASSNDDEGGEDVGAIWILYGGAW